MPDKLLTIEHLNKQYSGNCQALKNIGFSISSGQAFGLIGPNGAGKSTLIYILANLIRRDSGHISIQGVPLLEGNNAYKARVGFVLDKPCLIDILTVSEYLELLGNLHHMDTSLLANRLRGLVDFFELNDKQHSRLERLSMGLRKRVALAAALVHDPGLLIMDEPFSSLDPYMAKKTLNLLIQLRKKGKAILITSHLLQAVDKLCTHAGIMNAGLLLYSDKIEYISPGNCAAADSTASWKNLEMAYYRIISGQDQQHQV